MACPTRLIETDPASAFEEGILNPLHQVSTPAGGSRYILIDALDEAEAWMDSCRVTWEGRMDRLGAHLEKIQGPSGSRGNDRRANS